MIVNVDMSLTALYHDMLAQDRQYRLEDEAGTSICVHCKGEKKRHFGDGTGRCSCSTLTRHFEAVGQEKWDKVKRALVLIEELKTL